MEAPEIAGSKNDITTQTPKSVKERDKKVRILQMAVFRLRKQEKKLKD